MALPPGTFGWIGSGFDCTCNCTFQAGFAYDDGVHAWTVERDGTCILLFFVGYLKSGCNIIEYDTADITVELFLNGSPISDPLIPIPNTVFPGGGAYWEKWKPTAGDVYTATVTLDCGYGNTLTREFTYTIPDPANTSCDCCSERTIDYVIVSGFTGDFAILNGTYALSSTGGGCTYGPDEIAAPALPSNPCGTSPGPLGVNGGAGMLFMAPAEADLIPGVTRSICYYYPGGGSVSASIHPTTELVTVTVQFAYASSRWRDVDVHPVTNPLGCTVPGGGCGLGYSWIFTGQCDGYVALASTEGSPPQNPTVSVFMIDR
jgi:hypothetical protein